MTASNSHSTRLAKDFHPTPLKFTQRECEILSLLSQGLPDKQITLSLAMSLSTLRTHMDHLFRKTGCRSRSGVVAFWLGLQ
jgi:DNA-binding NarL/FixJ family response regulator